MCSTQFVLRRCGRCQSAEIVDRVDTLCDKVAQNATTMTTTPEKCPFGFIQLEDCFSTTPSKAACRECRAAQAVEGMAILQNSGDMMAVRMNAQLNIGDAKQ